MCKRCGGWLIDRVERGGEEKQEWDRKLRGGDSSIYIYAKKNTCCYYPQK
jgi:hypothetical protein